MSRICQGDPAAFEALFLRYSPSCMALALRILRQRHLAQDAVQEGFASVWRYPHRYVAERGSVQSWLMSTIHHRAVDLVRREEAHQRRVTGAGTLRPTVAPPQDPAELVVEEVGSAEMRSAVRRALKALPAEQRRVLELMYFDGYTQTQISERLGAPLGTVKSRTHRGMLHMRSALEEIR